MEDLNPEAAADAAPAPESPAPTDAAVGAAASAQDELAGGVAGGSLEGSVAVAETSGAPSATEGGVDAEPSGSTEELPAAAGLRCRVHSDPLPSPESIGLADTDAEAPLGGFSPVAVLEPSGEVPLQIHEPSASSSGKAKDNGYRDASERRIWRRHHNKRPDEHDEPGNPWYKHGRHLMIFTYSGKPVYTRYGSDQSLSGTTGALAAIVSKMAMFFFANKGCQDSLRYMVAGDHLFVFLERGPLWLVSVSNRGDTYYDLLRLLDRVHLQVITILTSSIEKTLTQRPNFDMRSLLGGTDVVVNNMIRLCAQDIFGQVDGYEPLPLSPAFRSIATEALRAARIPNILMAFLMVEHRVLAIVTNRQYKQNALDMMLLINLIMSSASLRNAESWTPVCLAHLNDKAFAYAYISFIEETDVGMVFLSSASDGEQFNAISQNAATVTRTLRSSGCLAAVAESAQSCPIDLFASSVDEAARRDKASARNVLLAPFPAGQGKLLDGIIHAAFFLLSSQQFFSSSIVEPYQTRRRTKMLFRSYGRCRFLLRNTKFPSQICIATDHECFYVWLTAEFHMYLAVPRGISTGVVGQFYQWIKSQEQHIFISSTPTW